MSAVNIVWGGDSRRRRTRASFDNGHCRPSATQCEEEMHWSRIGTICTFDMSRMPLKVTAVNVEKGIPPSMHVTEDLFWRHFARDARPALQEFGQITNITVYSDANTDTHDGREKWFSWIQCAKFPWERETFRRISLSFHPPRVVIARPVPCYY